MENNFLYNACVPNDVLESIIKNREYNKVIQGYYRRFAGAGGSIAFDSDLLKRKAIRMSSCNAYWQNDFYIGHHLKDFKRTILCRDKFCSNCKKVKQSGRMAKYIPFLEPYKENLYHVTLTIPNCSASDLRCTCKKMAVAFRKFIGILTGRQIIKGLDFSYWGYAGAIRSLEVTFNNSSYHPHYHVAFTFADDFELLDEKREIINSYSFSYGVLNRLWHEKEILIQKIWYLLYNDLLVTKKSIDDLEIGYTCSIQHFADCDYAELFKYMTKETKEDGQVLTYDNFLALYFGLYSLKQIQGYGCFYMVSDSSDLDSMEKIYDELMNEIREKERPLTSCDTPAALLKDEDNIIISRKSYFKYLNQLVQDT